VGLAIEDFNGTQIKMSLKFTDYNDYILVEAPTGMNYWEIIEGIPKLISMPEFKNKNNIWLFISGQINMAYTDLYAIKNLVEEICPHNSKGTKTAIVAENSLQQSLGKLYSDIGKDLQREIRVFLDLKSAENWIIQ
jgi:wyosine [tRNA(Phe)-imidazoG37] synthetase (radical SAM superfamily)